MTILLIGLNYHTAPIELRERLYLTGTALQQALNSFRDKSLPEVVVLSTCNRLEIYAHTENVSQATETITAYLAAQSLLSTAEMREYLQWQVDREAIEHLMRVACGLESLVLGESEILGQVADALKQAGAAGAVLTRLFQNSIHAGKRARTETAISQHTLSISHAAVLMAKRQIPDLSHAHVLILGAGRMSELAVRALKAHGTTHIKVMNRTLDRAFTLANRNGVIALPWEQLRTALCDADVVITATSAPQPILNVGDVPSEHTLVVLDIAVPRNVHPDVRHLPNVQLYGIDDLQAVVEDHHSKRQSEIVPVERLIAEELTVYQEWLNIRGAASTIVALREKAEAQAEAELMRAFNRLPDLSDHEREVFTQMAHRIVHKLLHAPTVALRERAAQGDHFTYMHAARQLFDLEIETDRD